MQYVVHRLIYMRWVMLILCWAQISRGEEATAFIPPLNPQEVAARAVHEGIRWQLSKRRIENRDRTQSAWRNWVPNVPCKDELKKAFEDYKTAKAIAAAKSETVPTPFPYILIHGERHDLKACIEDGEDLTRRAAETRLFLGLEGVLAGSRFKDETGKTLHYLAGLEEKNSSLLSVFFVFYGELLDTRDGHVAPKERYYDWRFLHGGSRLRETLASAWKDAPRKEITDPREKKIAELLDELLTDPSITGKRISEVIGALNRTADTPEGISANLNITRTLIYAVARQAERNRSPQDPLSIGLEVAHALPEIHTQGSSGASFDYLVVDWRNHIMSQAFLNEYCKNWKKRRPFHAIVGKAHLSGIVNDVAKAFRSVFEVSDLPVALLHRDGEATNELMDKLFDHKSDEHFFEREPIQMITGPDGNLWLRKQEGGRRFLLPLESTSESRGIRRISGDPLAIPGQAYIQGNRTQALTKDEFTRLADEFLREIRARYTQAYDATIFNHLQTLTTHGLLSPP